MNGLFRLAFEKLQPPEVATATPHGVIFEQATLAPIRHANGRTCWTLHLEYASRLWEGAATDEAKQRVATQLESDMDAIFGGTRRAVQEMSRAGVLPEVGAVFISVDEPGGRSHPHGAFTERAYFIGGDCK
jgi:hypothetical protein